tara:strand:+ start:8022 stop:10040 length:2019 start_codon:yes stop_codon:yes gene_type:complete
MQAPLIPNDEEARLEALDALAILDTAPEPEFDEIARTAARLANVPVALVSLVDKERQWFKAKCGLDAAETSRSTSFCGHAVLERTPLIIADTFEDDRFRDNPLVVGEPGIRFYAGFPIRSLGHAIGTLCIIDHVPRTLTERQVRLLGALARQVEVQLEFRRREIVSPKTGFDAESRQSNAAQLALSISFRIRLHPTLKLEALGGDFQKLTGYRPEDCLGNVDLATARVHPDDRPLLGLALNAPATFARPLALRWRVANGQWLWLMHEMNVRMEDERAAFVEGTAYPSSRSEKTETQTSDKTKLFAQTLDVLTIVDLEGRIRYQNPAATEVFGYASQDVVGRNAWERIHPDDQSGVADTFLTLVGGDTDATSRLRYRYRHKDGSWKTVESIARNLSDDPAVGGILMQTRDMSAWADIEQSLASAQEQAKQIAESRQLLIEDLRRVQEDKQQLFALIVHDLKSPLMAVAMNAQLVYEDAVKLGMDLGPVVDIIDAGDVLQRMVIDVLDVSRSESGQLTPRFAVTSISDLVERCCKSIGGVFRGRQQELVFEERLTQPALAMQLDASLIERLLQNLLDNSSKYSPYGSAIRVRVSDGEGHVHIDVLDEGPGIPDRYKKQVFELYAQLDAEASKHARTSRGLGLAFCKLAVEAHRGRIWVEDRPEGGSVFRTVLPV